MGSPFYRKLFNPDDLECFRVKIEESDLLICARKRLEKVAENILLEARNALKLYIEKEPLFLHSFVPVQVGEGVPEIVKLMAETSSKAGVGPMASVAGAVAEVVGKRLLDFSSEVIVENGGDIFLNLERERVVSVFAGSSPFSMKIGIRLFPGRWGVATSSGTVGHSVSFGKADAAVVISHSSALSDAFATALGNRISSAEDIEKALQWIAETGRKAGVVGALAVVGDRLGIWGDITLCKI